MVAGIYEELRVIDGAVVPSNTGREAAFAGLVDRRVLDQAYRYATLMLGDASEAEDATHDAAVIAWTRFGELRDTTRFDAWFGRILANTCRDRLRGRRRSVTWLGQERARILAAGNRPGDPADAVGRRELLAVALRSLSPEHREAVVLRFYLDLTVDQIALRTGVGAGTVKSRLHYALRHLRSAVDAQEKGSLER